MNILSIDTTANNTNISLKDKSNITSDINNNPRGQVSFLFPMIVKILDSKKLKFSNLDILLTATGPGSFTGIRVGLSAMQGISLATGIPIVGINNFDIYAHSLSKSNKDNNILVLLESFRKEVFCKFYNKDTANDKIFQASDNEVIEFLSNIKSNKQTTICGNADKILSKIDNLNIENTEHAEVNNILPSKIMIEIFTKEITKINNIKKLAQKNLAAPFYLRPPDISISKKLT